VFKPLCFVIASSLFTLYVSPLTAGTPRARKLSRSVEGGDQAPVADSLFEEGDPLDCAYLVSQALSSGVNVEVLINLADAYIRAGHSGKALKVLANARQSSDVRLSDESHRRHRSYALRLVAAGYVRAGRFDVAMQILNDVADPFQKTFGIADLANGYASEGQKAKASELLFHAVKTINLRPNDVGAQRVLVIAFARAGEYAQAIRLARATAKQWTHFEAEELVEIASEYRKAGNPVAASQILLDALETAERIKNTFISSLDPTMKAQVLCKIALVYLDIEQKDKAMEVLSRSLQIAKGTESNSHELRGIAIAYAKADELEQAGRVAQMIKIWTSDVLVAMARGYEQRGLRAKALELLAMAFASLKADKFLMIEHDDLWSKLLEELAVAYVEFGQFEKAILAAETITFVDAQYRARALARIAFEYAKANQRERAAQLFMQALKSAKAAKYPRDQLEALIAIADQYTRAKLNVDDKAKKILHEIVRKRVT
jgi:tetratricopeptide (TPR) repeat protein